MNEPFNPSDYLLYCAACGAVGESLPYKKWSSGAPEDHVLHILGTHRKCPNPMSGGSNMAHVCYLDFNSKKFPHALSVRQFRALSPEEQQRALELMKEDIRKTWEPEMEEDHFMYCCECCKIAEKLPFEYDRVAKKKTHSPSDCSCGGGCVFFVEPSSYMPHGMLISEYNALPEDEKAGAMALMKQDIIDWQNDPMHIYRMELGDRISAQISGHTALVKCPNCGSYRTNQISPGSQLLSAFVFGVFSKRIHQNYKCCDCGYKW